MSFVKAELEVIQQLAGFRLSLFLAVAHEEFEGGGVCRLSAAELADKYAQIANKTNCQRVRRQLIREGWLIEVVGGIVTKKFDTTAKNAVVEEKSELQNLQLVETGFNTTAKIAVAEPERLQNLQLVETGFNTTAKIAVETLQNLQSGTAKIAGTEVANKDLEFKEFNLNPSLSPAGVRPPVRAISVSEIFGPSLDELLPEEYSPTRAIEIYREIYPTSLLGGDQLADFAARLPEVEETVWRQNLLDWKLSGWQSSNLAGIIERYESKLKKSNKEGLKKNGTGKDDTQNGRTGGDDRPEEKQPSRSVRTRLRARPPADV